MKFQDFNEAVGRITPYNQTADVGPDEIKKQAAKFGNKVDKDGRPPTLSSKVKGKSTNVLFNLGMTEGKKKKDPRLVKPRDPNWQQMQDIRQSGAAGSHKDKTKTIPRKDKYKNKFDEDVAKGKELANTSEIYVDMDGVLVDFFGAWNKMMGVNDWKEIKNVNTALQKIRDDDNFWLSLKPTSNAGKLLGIIKRIKGEYKILSAPLAGDPKAEPHKREWVEKYLKVFPPKQVIITADKQKYARQPDGTPNILIDDFGVNVRKWEAAGGVGFKHKDHKFERTAQQLADYLDPKQSEAIAEILGFAIKNPKRTTIKKKRAPEEPSVQDKLKARRAAAAKGDKDAYTHKFKKDENVDEGALKIPAGGLAELVSDMVSNLDPRKDTKKLADIARMLGKEVYFKNDSIVLQDPDFDPNKKDSDTDEGALIPNPKNTFITKSDDTYDFMKIGQNIANVKSMPPGSNMDTPDVVIAPYAGSKETKYLMKQLQRIGYDVQDGAGYQDAHYDDKPTGGEAPPQIKGKDVKGKRGVMSLDKLVPVQRDRSFEKLMNQYKNVEEDTYNDIVVDRKGRIVNGHHRYDSLKLHGKDMARVVMIDDYVENLVSENFADGKKPGRKGLAKRSGVNCKASVSSLRKTAKNSSGEKARMAHWCANMKSGKKKGK